MSSTSKKARVEAQPVDDATTTAKAKKGPTPRRREREQQNLRPIVPADRKQAKREQREQARKLQEEQRDGMARGDDKYLRPQDRGPQKRFTRDVVDARFNVGEALLPAMFLVVIVQMFVDPTKAFILYGFMAVYAIAWSIDSLIVARSIKRRISEVLGGKDRVESGIARTVFGRSSQLRFARMPKPRVKRGAKLEYTEHYR